MAVRKKYDNVSRFEWMEFDDTASGAKDRINELKASGIVIESYAIEPVIYRYKVKYVPPSITKDQIKNEEWRDIPGRFFGRYQVSNFKRLRAVRMLADYGTAVLVDNENKRCSIKVDSLHKLAFK